MKKVYRMLLLVIFAGLCMYSNSQVTTIIPGNPAPFIKLRNIDGRMISFDDYPSAKGFIVVFICNTCPFSKAYEQRIIDLGKKYSRLHFPLFAINPNDPALSPGDSFLKMQEHARLMHFPFPYLYDDAQRITDLYGAKCTPFVFIVSKNAGNYTVEYTGAIDNDIKNNKPDKIKYAEDAVNALVNNTKPAIPVTKAIGCSISRKKS